MSDFDWRAAFPGLGTLGIAQYVHVECENEFLQSLPSRGKVIEPARTRNWTPDQLIGQFADITQCDWCGRKFDVTDSQYRSFWVTTQEELDRQAGKQS